MIVVYGMKEKLDPIKNDLSGVIHNCMMTVLACLKIKEQQPYQWGFRGMTGDEAKDLKYQVNV